MIFKRVFPLDRFLSNFFYKIYFLSVADLREENANIRRLDSYPGTPSIKYLIQLQKTEVELIVSLYLKPKLYLRMILNI